MVSKGSFLAISLAMTAFLSGCMCLPSNNQGSAFVCNPPYIQMGNSCCLDQDQNNICDSDEVTTTLMETTTTLKAATTTQPPAATVTTAAPTATTTTLAAIACSVNKDCGEIINYTKCYNGDVVMYTETPVCTSPGKPSAECVMKSRINPHENCPDGTRCVSAQCVNESLISCSDACYDKGYLDSYCNPSSSCSGADVRASLGDISCSPGATDGYCCCNADSLTTATTIPTHAACIAAGSCAQVLGPGANECASNAECLGAPIAAHSICSGGACITVIGSGSNECSADTDCSSTPSIPIVMHRACSGHACTWVFGPGSDECTSSLQCISGFSFHNVCSGGSCVVSIGSGANQCTTNAQCFIGPTLPPTTLFVVTHKECVGTTCKDVFGAGANQCTTNFQCLGYSPVITHSICQGGQCVVVIGAGTSTCTKNIQCISTLATLSPTVTLNPVITTITVPKYIQEPGLPGY